MEIQELKALIKESVREVLREEMLLVSQGSVPCINENEQKQKFALFLSQIPYVSDEEQADIEKHFGLPSDYDRDEFVDMTAWVRNETSI